MNTVQMRLFFMVFAAFCTLALAQNAPELAISEKAVVKKGIGKLAVLRPKVSKDIDEGTVETLWSALESLAAKHGPYTVILRNDKDLGGLIKEIGFQGTHLVDKTGEKILPGEIKAVNALLCSSIGKFDKGWMLDLKIVNAQTGTINRKYNVHSTFNSLDEINQSLEYQVQLLFKEEEELKDAMLLEPVCEEGIKVNAKKFVASLEKILSTKVNISNTSLKTILTPMKKNDISELKDMDWPHFHREAKVRYLVIPRITSWKLEDGDLPITFDSKIVRVIKICTLTAECEIQVIDTRDGSTKHRIQLEENINNVELGGENMSVTDFKKKCHENTFKQWSKDAAGKLVNYISELKALEKD